MNRQWRSDLASTIRANAAAFLESRGIPTLLRRFGDLHYTGSYALDLMTWNDVDLQLVLREGRNPMAALGGILQSLASAKGFREARLIRFLGAYQAHMPRGIFLGLRFDAPEWGGAWKVDLWVLEPDDFERNQNLLRDLRERLDPENRDLILELKHALMTGQDRVPAMASHQLYRFVLLDGLRKWEELRQAFQSAGLHLALRRQAGALPVEAFKRWREDQKALGQRLVDEALHETAIHHDVLLVVKPVNPAALPQFLRPDAQSKGPGVQGRTLRTGLQGGFLPPVPDHPRKPLTFALDDVHWAAVVRDGEERLVAEPLPGDRVLEVRCQEDGACITADLDLVLIAARRTADEGLQDPEYGQLAALEKPIILDLNQRFRDLVDRHYPGRGSRFKLVAHGPLNRCTGARVAHLHAPLQIHTPWGGPRVLDGTAGGPFNELRRFLASPPAAGYTFHLNPNWSA